MTAGSGKELWWFGRGNGLALCVHGVGIVPTWGS